MDEDRRKSKETLSKNEENIPKGEKVTSRFIACQMDDK